MAVFQARLPSPNKTIEELAKVNPQLPTLLPGLAAMLTPVPVVGPFRTAIPFLFAVAALLWMQRKAVYVYR